MDFRWKHDVAWPDLVVFKEIDSFNLANGTKYSLQTVSIHWLNFHRGHTPIISRINRIFRKNVWRKVRIIVLQIPIVVYFRFFSFVDS